MTQIITNKYDLERIRLIPITKVLGIQDLGRRRMIKCPFHDDSTASLALYPNGGYHCFGCGKHGHNAIDFCIHLGYTFQQSLQELNKYK